MGQGENRSQGLWYQKRDPVAAAAAGFEPGQGRGQGRGGRPVSRGQWS